MDLNLCGNNLGAGVRALGHTFGHAIEAATGYGSWLHGEAVSAGTCMAAKMSADLGWCDKEIFERTEALLKKCGTPVDVKGTGMTREQFLGYMSVDKKNAGGISMARFVECIAASGVSSCAGHRYDSLKDPHGHLAGGSRGGGDLVERWRVSSARRLRGG